MSWENVSVQCQHCRKRESISLICFPLTRLISVGVALASTLQMSPDAMATCWEAFSLTKQVSELTTHTFEAYKTQVYKHSEFTPLSASSDGAVQSRNIKRQASLVTPPTAKRQVTPSSKGSSSSVDSVAIINSNSPVASARPATTLPKYDERIKAGHIVTSFNPKEWPAIMATTASSGHRCMIRMDEFLSSNVTEPYRHMFTAISDRANALEKQLQIMGKNLIDKYGISDDENGIAPLEQVNIPRQEAVCCVGRICNEVRRHTGTKLHGLRTVHISDTLSSHPRLTKESSTRLPSCWRVRARAAVELASMLIYRTSSRPTKPTHSFQDKLSPSKA